MPKSCKCILDRMVFKGAMTKAERDKIVRNLKTQNEGRKTMGKLIDVDAFKARLSAGLVYQGADVLEALDEQPAIEERKTDDVLDKIRAEIMKLDDINPDYPMDMTVHISRYAVLQIIDKYKGESEEGARE